MPASPYREIVRQMGKDGWLGVGWPKEYGGQGCGPIEQLIFLEEAGRAGAPIPMVTLNTVGPTLAQFGTDEQKERFLPAILPARSHFAIGYTEPGAGTDLASLRTRAVRDGDEYVVNGQKIFTTGGHDADFIWLACRTDPDAPKHKGICILLVDRTTPGFKWTPIHVVGGGHTNATYYEDVRVPADMLGRRGERRLEDDHHAAQLRTGRARPRRRDSPGRSSRSPSGPGRPTAPEGGRSSTSEWVRLNLARIQAKAEAAELFNWRVAALQEKGELNPADASAMKVYGTELRIESARLLMEILGAAARCAKGHRRGAEGPSREGVPARAGGHVRRRRQRDPARDHRHGRTALASCSQRSVVPGFDNLPRGVAGVSAS